MQLNTYCYVVDFKVYLNAETERSALMTLGAMLSVAVCVRLFLPGSLVLAEGSVKEQFIRDPNDIHKQGP